MKKIIQRLSADPDKTVGAVLHYTAVALLFGCAIGSLFKAELLILAPFILIFAIIT